MFLSAIKKKLYRSIVEFHPKIRAHYEGYKDSNPEYHKKHRFQSLKFLHALRKYYKNGEAGVFPTPPVAYTPKIIPSSPVKSLPAKKSATPKTVQKPNPSVPKTTAKNAGVRQTTKGPKLPYLDGAESSLSYKRNELYIAKKLKSYDVISFDIFDTLLLRPFSKPADLFFILGHRHNILDFKRIRVEAERTVREYHKITRGNHEVTIYDIYEEVERKTGLPVEVGVKTEFEVELEFCFANPYMKRIFDMVRQSQKTIIACSDMYFPQEYIKRLLEKCGYTGFDRILISCDYNCSKRSKGLYRILKNSFENKTIIHVGDNYTTDIQHAQAMGIDTFHYQNVHDIGNRYRPNGMSELSSSCYAGIVNTTLHNGTKLYSPWYEYGFIYGGIYVLGFCNWIHKYAVSHQIDRVIFLSRDGEIYRKVFNMMFQDVKNSYLFWSRIVNAKCTVDVNRDSFLTQMIKHKAVGVNPITLENLLLSLDLSHLIPLLSHYHLNKEEFLTQDNQKMLETVFVENWEKIEQSYQSILASEKNVIQNMLGDAKRVAVVDVGWTGSGPLGIKYLVEEKWKMNCQVDCLLAGSRHASHEQNINQLQEEKTIPYIFSRMYNRNLYDLHTGTNKGVNSIFFELFTQADYPSFSGMRGKEFLFDNPEVENYQIIHEIHKGIYDFSKRYYDTFSRYPYLFNISGYDAYQPFSMIIRDLKFFKKFFGKFSFARNIGMDISRQQLETIDQIFKKANL